jgi:hypothetical protein
LSDPTRGMVMVVPENRSYDLQIQVCEKRPEYRPYGYTRAPSEGGCCAECGATDGGHERDCEVCS